MRKRWFFLNKKTLEEYNKLKPNNINNHIEVEEQMNIIINNNKNNNTNNKKENQIIKSRSSTEL